MKSRALDRVLVVSALLGVAAGPGVSIEPTAGPRPLTLAIFAPNAAFESGAERFDFVQRLAQQVTSAASVAVAGRAFARAQDLEAAIRNRRVDFAVLDGVYVAERGLSYPVLATATSAGETAPKWALYAREALNVAELAGKKLALAAAGPRDTAFLENALLEGEVRIATFFAAARPAPDMSSAVAAVHLKQADAVFAPEGAGQGLRKVFEAARVPNPAFCQIAPNLAPEVVARVKTAVLAAGGGSVFDGWKSSGAEAYRALAQRMEAHARRPVMVEPEPVPPPEADVWTAPKLEPVLADLKSQLIKPAP